MSSLRCRLFNHWIPLIALLGTSALPAFSANFSFTGTFTHDNDVQFFAFSLLSSGTVTLQTFGYGGTGANPGGVNAAGNVIGPGGFESILTVFDATGNQTAGSPLSPGPDPTCGFRAPDPGRFNFCQDAYGQLLLGPGDYVLALTQSQNGPAGTLSDGFVFTDVFPDPNFNNGFVGSGNLPGNGNWAVDILSVDRASVVGGGVPEPASVLMTGASLLVLGLGVRRRRRA